jgi:hypothetical protein
VGSTTIIIIFVLLLVLILFVIPAVWRRLDKRNARRVQVLRPDMVQLSQALRAAAARLRPFRDLEATFFQQRYQPARERLQRAVDGYREALAILDAIDLAGIPDGLLPFPHFLAYPRDLVNVPRDFFRLRDLEREVARLHDLLAEAQAAISRAEEGAVGLGEAVQRLIREQIPTLQQVLATEQDAGIEDLGELEERLAQLEARGATLAQQIPSQGVDLAQLNRYAQALAEFEADTGQLEADLTDIRRARELVDSQLLEVSEARAAAFATATDESLVEAIAPLIDHADQLASDARILQRKQQFHPAAARTGEASSTLALAQTLGATALQVRDLLELAERSLDPEAIEILSRRLYAAFRAAYAIVGAPGATEEATAAEPSTPSQEPLDTPESRKEALEALQLRVNRLAAEAEQLEQSHESNLDEMERDADHKAQLMAQAWQALQQVVALPTDDPVTVYYRELLEKRAAASGNALQLRAFAADAAELTSHLQASLITVRDGLDRVEALRTELPQLVEAAEAEAGNWRCLKPYVAEMKEVTATIWQLQAHDVTLGELKLTLTELDLLEEQARAAYSALSGERKRLSILERRIAQIRDNLPAPGPSAQATALATAQVTAAQGATSVAAAVAALQDALQLLREGATYFEEE